MSDTGKVEYAPDYKSRVQVKRIAPSAEWEHPAVEAQSRAKREANVIRARLEREVIDAAKRYRLAVREHVEYATEYLARDPSHDEDEDPTWDAQLGAQCAAEQALSDAVDALHEFESSQEKKG